MLCFRWSIELRNLPSNRSGDSRYRLVGVMGILLVPWCALCRTRATMIDSRIVNTITVTTTSTTPAIIPARDWSPLADSLPFPTESSSVLTEEISIPPGPDTVLDGIGVFLITRSSLWVGFLSRVALMIWTVSTTVGAGLIIWSGPRATPSWAQNGVVVFWNSFARHDLMPRSW